MKNDDRMLRCSMCDAVIEDVYLMPDLIARFYKWTGMVSNENGVSYRHWYCSRYSIDDIRNFEGF